jgi:hypothetical protein
MKRSLIGAALALLFAVCTTLPTAANESDPVDALFEDEEPLALVLARYGVHEANFFRARADHLAIWEALRQRAWGPLFNECLGDLRCAAKLYSAGRSEAVTNDRNRWVLGLNLAGTKPDGWPDEEVRWSERHSRAFRGTVVLAHDWLQGRVRPQCRYRPMHWGSRRHPTDRTRANRALLEGRWRDAECVDDEGRRTRNGIYCVRGRCEW